jgi:hypothetical protein
MIFKKLFKKAHTHADADVRLSAIKTLNPQQEKDKQILHELAFNDECVSVSMAALEALASFTLYLKAYETHFKNEVKVQAKAKVLKLIEDPQQASDTLFFDIVKQLKHNDLLKTMLFSSLRLQEHSELCVTSALQICNEQELKRFYCERATDAQKRHIIASTTDEKRLKRYSKLGNSIDIASDIAVKLNEIAEAAAKPVKVKAAATLINSRLLALYELNDFEAITRQKQQLQSEFVEIKQEFLCLSEEDSTQLSSKYLYIKEKVDKRLAQLEPEYQSQLHSKALNDSISDIQNRMETIAGQVNLLCQSDTDTQLESQTELLTRAIEDLDLELNDLQVAVNVESLNRQSKQHQRDLNTVRKSFEDNLTLLKALPEQIARNGQIDALLEQVKHLLSSELEDVTNKTLLQSADEQGYAALAKQLENLVQKGTSAARMATWQAIKAERNAHKKQEREAKAREEKRCFSKLAACLRMIEQGKYKAAIATFRAAKTLYDTCSAVGASTSLSRKFEESENAVSELQDWQSYIATPRKPELIVAAKALADNNEIDVSARAALVRQYRTEYNSLGRLHNDEDDSLNKEFDMAIEAAFAPCRTHFEAQDKQREHNLQKGEQVLEALDALSSVEQINVLSKHLAAISQQYRKLGEMDKRARNKLHKGYLAKLKPLQAKVNAFYDNNAQLKQSLIDKASALAELEDIEAAVASAKSLQRQWKNIGFSGAKKDNALWEAFRKANDVIFARLNMSIEAQKAEDEAQSNLTSEALSTLKAQVELAQDGKSLSEVAASIAEVAALVARAPKAKQTGFNATLSSCKKAYQNKLERLQDDKSKAQMQHVFDVLATYSKPLDDEQLSALPAKFKQAFIVKSAATNSSNIMAELSREELLLAANIMFSDAAGNNTTNDSEAKKSVQLKLMASKLQGHSLPDADALLTEWIARGPLSSADLALLPTLKVLYGVK